MDKDELTRSRIEECIRRCAEDYYITSTRLLDSHEQLIALNASRTAAGVHCVMYGGYAAAERRMLVCIPSDYGIGEDEATEGLLKVLRVTTPRGSRKLSHRDYLGSVLGLGLDRSVTGDILVREDGADMIIIPEIAEFLMNEYRQVGRSEIKTSLEQISELIIPDVQIRTVRDTVSSARLDNVVASAFRLSRSRASEAIRSGLVSVDHIEETRPDAKVGEGAVIVLRGKGKAKLSEVGGESKKGRIWIRLDLYI